MTSPGGSETGSLLQGVSRFAWLLTAQVNPEPPSEITKPKSGLATTFDPGGRREPRVGRGRMVGHRAVAAGLGRGRALHQHAVFAAVRREAAQAVEEEQVLGQSNRLVGPGGGLARGRSAGRAGGVALGAVELAGQRAAVADQHDAGGGLEQHLLVLAHLRALADEDPAGLIDRSRAPTDRTASRICRFSSSR